MNLPPIIDDDNDDMSDNFGVSETKMVSRNRGGNKNNKNNKKKFHVEKATNYTATSRGPKQSKKPKNNYTFNSPAANPWLTHVAKVQSKKPNIPYKDVLKLAKNSYTKVRPKTKAEKTEYARERREDIRNGRSIDHNLGDKMIETKLRHQRLLREGKMIRDPKTKKYKRNPNNSNKGKNIPVQDQGTRLFNHGYKTHPDEK